MGTNRNDTDSCEWSKLADSSVGQPTKLSEFHGLKENIEHAAESASHGISGECHACTSADGNGFALIQVVTDLDVNNTKTLIDAGDLPFNLDDDEKMDLRDRLIRIEGRLVSVEQYVGSDVAETFLPGASRDDGFNQEGSNHSINANEIDRAAFASIFFSGPGQSSYDSSTYWRMKFTFAGFKSLYMGSGSGTGTGNLYFWVDSSTGDLKAVWKGDPANCNSDLTIGVFVTVGPRMTHYTGP